MMNFTLNNLEDWEETADAILQNIKHNILLLEGNLGAGKTTFTQFLLKKLGSSDEVTSPTYALVNEYRTPRGKVFHFDLYRINSVEEIFDIGMDEYLENSFLCIIEWPEIYMDELRTLPHHKISIQNDEGVRTVHFS